MRVRIGVKSSCFDVEEIGLHLEELEAQHLGAGDEQIGAALPAAVTSFSIYAPGGPPVRRPRAPGSELPAGFIELNQQQPPLSSPS